MQFDRALAKAVPWVAVALVFVSTLFFVLSRRDQDERDAGRDAESKAERMRTHDRQTETNAGLKKIERRLDKMGAGK